GVRALMLRAGEEGRADASVHGLIADVISVPAQFEKAIEAALGERLQSVIVDDRHKAIELIDYLKSASEGRSSFLPLNGLSSGPEAPPPDLTRPGVLAAADGEVVCDPLFQPLVRALLRGVVIVSDLPAARDYAEAGGAGYTLVTLEGDVLWPNGAATGGGLEGPAIGALQRKGQVGGGGREGGGGRQGASHPPLWDAEADPAGGGRAQGAGQESAGRGDQSGDSGEGSPSNQRRPRSHPSAAIGAGPGERAACSGALRGGGGGGRIPGRGGAPSDRAPTPRREASADGRRAGCAQAPRREVLRPAHRAQGGGSRQRRAQGCRPQANRAAGRAADQHGRANPLLGGISLPSATADRWLGALEAGYRGGSRRGRVPAERADPAARRPATGSCRFLRAGAGSGRASARAAAAVGRAGPGVVAARGGRARGGAGAFPPGGPGPRAAPGGAGARASPVPPASTAGGN